ncbi:hypothetical protein W97_08394 [Coniosporium apollinis CBS 100218]|uniref:Uncharacterized protein n=1 Tax=Coniosporium apollinis (strain CBS 100218) TaxID=1168221 RepID=R7Z5A0_CONA1|nr:uncharacterized protein W97_08394 [Coniosporium apollinis CBS 100218]EON69081.1 hypothetical protein W97_08394 [Coniosporium apollinis CBS 100218]
MQTDAATEYYEQPARLTRPLDSLSASDRANLRALPASPARSSSPAEAAAVQSSASPAPRVILESNPSTPSPSISPPATYSTISSGSSSPSPLDNQRSSHEAVNDGSDFTHPSNEPSDWEDYESSGSETPDRDGSACQPSEDDAPDAYYLRCGPDLFLRAPPLSFRDLLAVVPRTGSSIEAADALGGPDAAMELTPLDYDDLAELANLVMRPDWDQGAIEIRGFWWADFDGWFVEGARGIMTDSWSKRGRLRRK